MAEPAIAAPRHDADPSRHAPAAKPPGSDQAAARAPPATALANPALAHPANAPVRTALIHDIQRGAGNQAALSAVARAGKGDGGTARSRPAPMPPPGLEATGDAPQSDPADAAEPSGEFAILPLQAPFEGATSAQVHALSFPRRKGGAVPDERPKAEAEASFAALRSQAETLHRATLDDANRRIDQDAAEVRATLQRLDSYQARSTQQIEAMEQVSDLEIDQSADAALIAAENAHTQAVRGLSTVARHAQGSVGGMRARADAENAAVCKYGVDLYTGALNAAIAAVTARQPEIEKKLDAWPSEVTAEGNDSEAATMRLARLEARRSAAPGLVKGEKESVVKLIAAHVKGFEEFRTKAVAPFGGEKGGAVPVGAATAPPAPALAPAAKSAPAPVAAPLSRSAEPKPPADAGKTMPEQLAAAATAGITQGYAAVERARHQAVAGIEQQHREAIAAIERMRRESHAALRAAGNAARTRLADTVREHKAALRTGGSRRVEGIVGGVQPALQTFVVSPERYGATLRAAAKQGPEALARAARAQPGGIQAAMENARRLHVARLAVDGAAMLGLTGHEERQCALDGERALDALRVRFGDSVAGAAGELRGQAKTEATAFAAITDGVRTSAEGWVKAYGAGMVANSGRYRAKILEGFKGFLSGGTADPAPNGKGAPAKTSARQGAPGAGGGPEPKGFTAMFKTIDDDLVRRLVPQTYFEPQLKEIDAAVFKRITETASRALVHASAGNGKLLNEQLREPQPPTAIEGAAINDYSGTRPNGPLTHAIFKAWHDGNLDRDDFHAALAYLRGDVTAAVSYEIKSSLGFWHDDKERIEKAMRHLTVDQAHHLDPEALEAARGWWHLTGTDGEVFDHLAKGDVIGADAVRAIDKIDKDKRSGDYADLTMTLKASHEAVMVDGKAYTAKEHQAMVFAAMASQLRQTRGGPNDLGAKGDDTAVLTAFVTEGVEIAVGDEAGTTYTQEISGANKALALAILNHGSDAVEKAQQLGVELQRPDGPTVEKLGTILTDERRKPEAMRLRDHMLTADDELAKQSAAGAATDREIAKAEADEVFLLFAHQYCGLPESNTSADDARIAAKQKFGERLASKDADTNAANDYVAGLIDTGFPTPEIAAKGMRYAMYGSWSHTNKDLMRQIVSRMNADDIGDMKTAFTADTKKDLVNELGLYGQGGSLPLLSGDTRLEFERLFLGVPRNDKERAALALFTIKQQETETGALGKAYARGKPEQLSMEQTKQELIDSLGGKASVNSQGRLNDPDGSFDERGALKARNREHFDIASGMAKMVTEGYANRVDQLASMATTVIAVIGAIVATVVTIATGGLAAPLLLAGIALGTGLAGMAAHRLVSGGRYGWHDAAKDFALTMVQALTAYAGASLALASRGGAGAIKAAEVAEEAIEAAGGIATAEQLALREGAQMGQILGSKGADMALIGTAGGAISGFGQGLVDERGRTKGIGNFLEVMLENTAKGALSGLATSVASQAVEGIRLPGGKTNLGEMVGKLGSVERGSPVRDTILRSVGKSLTGTVGAVAGKSVDIGWEGAAGRFHGGVAEELAGAAAFAAIQSGLEGAAEAPTEYARSSKRAGRIDAMRARIDREENAGGGSGGGIRSGGGDAEAARTRAAPSLDEAAMPMPAAGSALEPELPALPRGRGTPPPLPDEAQQARPRLPGGADPADATPEPLRERDGFTLLPSETVAQPGDPTSMADANEMYHGFIVDQPDREAAVFRNPETREFIIVQGDARSIAVAADDPLPRAGAAQRWKELLTSPDKGHWELVAHFHPAETIGGPMAAAARVPSGRGGDLSVVEGESVASGQPRSSRIHYLENGEYQHTDFGYDPTAPTGRYWVEHPDPATGGRKRVTFDNLGEYDTWFAAGPARSATATPHGAGPPAARPVAHAPTAEETLHLTNRIDAMLEQGVPIGHPDPMHLATAITAFKAGTPSPDDTLVVLRQAVADARTLMASDRIKLSPDGREAALTWNYVAGRCGSGRDFAAVSLGTMLLDAQNPVLVRRFQAADLGGTKHGFTIVSFKDEPGFSFVIDPTFAQFMRPRGESGPLERAHGDIARKLPGGPEMAHALLGDGFIPITPENAAIYAHALDVKPEDVPGAIAKMLRGEGAILDQAIGGPGATRPLPDDLGSVDAMNADDIRDFIGERMRAIDMVGARSANPATSPEIGEKLGQFKARIDEAIGPAKEDDAPADGPDSAPIRPRSGAGAHATGDAGAPPPAATPSTRPAQNLAPLADSVVEPLGAAFRGDTLREPDGMLNRAVRAIEDLNGAPGSLGGRIRPLNEESVRDYILVTRNGEVPIHIEFPKTMAAGRRGPSVASASFDTELGGYVVRLPTHAEGGVVRRALADQLTRIVAGHAALPVGEEAPLDALRKGGGKTLTPTDEGQIAQFVSLAEDLRRQPGAADTIKAQMRELAKALALTGPDKAATERLKMALTARDLTGHAAGLLTEAAGHSTLDPTLMKSTGLWDDDLAQINAALAHAGAALSPEAQEALVRLTAQALIDQRIVQAGKKGGVLYAWLGTQLGVTPEQAIRIVNQPGTPFERLLKPAITRAGQGDLSITAARLPQPGYEARMASAQGDLLVSPNGKTALVSPRGNVPGWALTEHPELLPVGKAIDDLLVQRNNPAQISQATEQLGLAAGRGLLATPALTGFIETPGATRPGAGVFDLVFEHPDGRIVVVECKGAGSLLKTRPDVGGLINVQQGTVEYMRSIAKEMIDNGFATDFAKRLLIALDSGRPNVSYLLVTQPITEDGSLATPKVGRFDLSPSGR